GAEIVPKITTDNAGGAYVTWADERFGSGSANQRVFVTHLLGSGVDLTWGDGIRVCMQEAGQSFPVICSDGSHGCYVAWNDRRRGTRDIYGQHIQSDATRRWVDLGAPVTAASGNQRLNGDVGAGVLIATATDVQSNAITPDPAGGFFATWTDDRTS